jgi:hypothetical protein
MPDLLRFNMKETIPSEYHCKAEKLVQIALKSESMNELYKKIAQEPSLTGMYIPDKIVYLVYNKKNSKLQNEVYLTACLHLSYDDLSKNNVLYGEFQAIESGCERLEKVRNVENIKRMLERLN